MATFTTAHTQSGAAARYTHSGPVVSADKYTIGLTASATDVVQLVKVQPGARVLNIRTWTNSVGLSYSVGDGDDTGKFQNTASAILTAGTVTASATYSVVRGLGIGTALGYSYSVADTIDFRTDTGGGLTGTLVYYAIELVYDQQEVV